MTIEESKNKPNMHALLYEEPFKIKVVKSHNKWLTSRTVKLVQSFGIFLDKNEIIPHLNV